MSLYIFPPMRPLVEISVPLLITMLLVASSRASGQTGLTGADIDRIGRAVVRIVALRDGQEVSSGSGTVVDANGRIYTNRHVVEGADDYQVELLEDPNELPVPRYRARLVGYSMDVDFALLQVDRSVDGQPLDGVSVDLPFLSSFAPDVQRGDEIFLFGYPSIGEGYLAFTQGTVTTIRNGTLNDQRIPVSYQTDAQMASGNSGGLAVNARGEMVGIPSSVRTEQETGGRLGGILAFNAVRVVLEWGLETDVSLIASVEDGALDISQPPTYGSVALAAGFATDPYSLDMVSGGEVQADYIGGPCTGYAAVAPDFRLDWTGDSSALRVFFAAANGDDTTLIVNLPDGSWVCNDDSAGTTDPMVVVQDPPEGQYDVWVGSYEAGAYVSGALHITERALDPTSVAPAELDYSREPTYGSLALRAGFVPSPNVSDVDGGGSVDVSYLGGNCVGYAARAPDLRLQWSGRSDQLVINFTAIGGRDTSLVVNLPDGNWTCADDSVSLDPLIVIEHPSAGQYDIWVGSFERGDLVPGELTIAERRFSP